MISDTPGQQKEPREESVASDPGVEGSGDEVADPIWGGLDGEDKRPLTVGLVHIARGLGIILDALFNYVRANPGILEIVRSVAERSAAERRSKDVSQSTGAPPV